MSAQVTARSITTDGADAAREHLYNTGERFYESAQMVMRFKIHRSAFANAERRDRGKQSQGVRRDLDEMM